MKARLLIGLMFVIALLAACGTQPGAGPSTDESPTEGAGESPTEAPGESTDGSTGESSGCAEPTDGSQLLTNGAAGYCLAYPAGFVLEGTTLDQWISPEPGRAAKTPPVPDLPWVNITVGETASQTVEDAVAAYMAAIDFNLVGEPTTLGGEPALMLDQVPGQELERKVFAVHDGQLYTLTFVPADPASEQFAQMESLYETVMSSFSFVERETSAVEIPDNLDDLVIHMERGPCFGACPMYEVTVYGDGRVEYLGRNFVSVEGEQQAQLSPEQVRLLVEEIYRSGFWEMEDRYEADVTDLPATTLTVTLDDQTKSVYDYYEPPPALTALERTIDEISGAAVWVRGEGTASPAPAGGWMLVQTTDRQLAQVSVDGEVMPLVTADVSLRPAGYEGAPMTDGPIAYTFNVDEGSLLQVVDTAAATVVPQTFIERSASTLAVHPISERAGGEDRPPLSLAWGEFALDSPTTRLYLAAPDGSEQRVVQEKTFAEGEAPFTFVPIRWSPDGSQLYYATEPYGLGGFIPFRAAGDLFVYNVADGDTETLFETGQEVGFCLDTISLDGERIAQHCDGELTVLNLASGERGTIAVPEGRTDSIFGTVRFSPDQTRIAYGLGTGDPENFQGAVAVSDALSGDSRIILSREESEVIHVVTWLDSETLLLQIYAETPSIWTVRADGNELTKIADGTLLAYSGLGS